MFHLCNVVLLLPDCFYFGYFVARTMPLSYVVLLPGSLSEIEMRKGLSRTAIDPYPPSSPSVVHHNAAQMCAHLIMQNL